jgi:hypothetical protein
MSFFLLSEQRLNFAAQLMVVATGAFQEVRALVFLQFQSTVI